MENAISRKVKDLISTMFDIPVTQVKHPDGTIKNVASVILTATTIIAIAKEMKMSIDGRELNQALFLSQYFSIAMGTGYIFTDDFEIWKYGPAQRKAYAQFACGTMDICSFKHDLSEASLMPEEYIPAMVKALMTIKINNSLMMIKAIYNMVGIEDNKTGIEVLHYSDIKTLVKEYNGEIPMVNNIII